MSLLDLLGPRPGGDPAAMRAYATQLRSVAGRIASTGQDAARALDRATFVGPAGEGARFRAGRLRGRAGTVADELRDVADEVTRRAGEVEDAQAGWDRLRDVFERQQREAAR